MITSLSSIEIDPNKPPIGAMILLHGLGADGNDFVPLISELNIQEHLPLRFVFPHAPIRPVTINQGYALRAWYDIYSMNISQRIDNKSIYESVELVEKLISEQEMRGIPSDKIILAGFSQGAVIALITALRFNKPLAGIMALSGYFPLSEEVIKDAKDCNRSTPIFVGHGISDFVVPYFLGQMTYDVLKRHHYPVEWHSYEMAHSVSEKEIMDIANWLKKIYKK